MSVSYKKEVRSSERPGSAPRGLKSSASAPSTPGTRSSSRSGETSSQSYVEFKRLQDKKEMDAIRKARREENMAFSVSKQVKAKEDEDRNLDKLMENQKQSKKTLRVKKNQEKDFKNSQQLRTEYQLYALKEKRVSKLNADLETDLIETKKEQSDLVSHMNAERTRQAILLKHEKDVARAECYRQVKKEKENDAEREKQFLEKEREKYILNAQMKQERKDNEKKLKHEKNRAEMESLNEIKKGRQVDDEKEKEFLAKNREQSRIAAIVKKDREVEDKKLKHEKNRAEMDGLIEIKKARQIDNEKEKENLLKNREQARIAAEAREDKLKQEKKDKHEFNKAQAKGYAATKTSTAMEPIMMTVMMSGKAAFHELLIGAGLSQYVKVFIENDWNTADDAQNISKSEIETIMNGNMIHIKKFYSLLEKISKQGVSGSSF